MRNGWYDDCRPTSRPTGRGATWARMGSPSATDSSIRRSRSRHASGWRWLWASESERGRPDLTTMLRINSNSPSVSGQKSEMISITPWPASATPSAIASSSSARARNDGVGSPVDVRWLSVRELEKPMAPARMASAARRAHGRRVLLGRIFEAGAPLAHHVEAERAVGELCRHVHVMGSGLDGVEVRPEALPRPLDPLVQHRAGDVLDALHEGDEPVVRVGPHRCEPDAAVAHHGGGDAVPARGGHAGVPGGLAVVVGVDVDETGSDQQPVGIDLLAAGGGHRPDGGDRPAVDGHVGRLGLAAQAVRHHPAPNHQIVCHANPSLCRELVRSI